MSEIRSFTDAQLTTVVFTINKIIVESFDVNLSKVQSLYFRAL